MSDNDEIVATADAAKQAIIEWLAVMKKSRAPRDAGKSAGSFCRSNRAVQALEAGAT
jgi:hypothetical protein